MVGWLRLRVWWRFGGRGFVVLVLDGFGWGLGWLSGLGVDCFGFWLPVGD